MADEQKQNRLAAVSDRIIRAIRALKAIERDKRQETPSTPPYHRLVEASMEKSKEIYKAASEQDALARENPGGPPIEEVSERQRNHGSDETEA